MAYRLRERFGLSESLRMGTEIVRNFREITESKRHSSSYTSQRHVQNAAVALATYRVVKPRIHDSAELQEFMTDFLWSLQSLWFSQQVQPILNRKFPFEPMIERIKAYFFKKVFPVDDFKIEVESDTDTSFQFNVNHCPYHTFFVENDAPELTKAICALDFKMAELYPKSVKFSRSQSIADGAKFCDFRYENLKPRPKDHKGL
jgi:hypothetical protein